MHILHLHCPDRPGIVAAVATCLAGHGCNIEDSSQFNDKFSNFFFMRTVFSPTRPNAATDFIAAFEKIGSDFSMTWTVHDEDARTPILIMVSKADHCLHDILYRWRSGQINVDIKGIVSNHADNEAIAQQHGIPFTLLPVTADNKRAQEEKLHQIVQETGAELIILARYMQVLSDDFCGLYPGRIINIHHSFLPGFKGAKPYHQAWERGVKIIGATAHFVTKDLDEGPIIEQETVRIDHAHGPEKMQVLGKDIESRVLSRAIAAYVERRVFLHNNRTVIL